MDDPVRMGVVGVGYLGQHHVRILDGLESVDLRGFVEIDDHRAEDIARRLGLRRFRSLEELVEECEAATVVVPTVDHAKVAGKLLDAGLDVMVEKPITRTEEEARTLVQRARAAGRILGVGHVERHNPAVDAVLRERPRARYFEAERIGVWVGRSLDVDVVLDLMVHDLDILRAFVPDPVVEIRAIGVPVMTDQVDIANVRLEFSGGTVANLTASRVSAEPVRKIRVFQQDAYFSIDTRSREVVAYRLDREGETPRIERLDIRVAEIDPLTAELDDFAHAVRERRDPKVTGEDGLEALALAERILAQISS